MIAIDFLKESTRNDIIDLIKHFGSPTKASEHLGVDPKVFNRYANKKRIKTSRETVENKSYTVYCRKPFCMNRPASSTGDCFACYAKDCGGLK